MLILKHRRTTDSSPVPLTTGKKEFARWERTEEGEKGGADVPVVTVRWWSGREDSPPLAHENALPFLLFAIRNDGEERCVPGTR